MTLPTESSPNSRFITAVLAQGRMVNESLVTPEPMPIREKGAEIKNTTTSTFELGVPDGEIVSSFQIFLGYSISLTLKDSKGEDVKLCTYESKFVSIFNVIATHGFDNWKDATDDAVSPYFAFVHYLARQRAEERLLAAGFRGVELPIPDNLVKTSA